MPTSGCCCICELINEPFTGLSSLPAAFTSVAGTWTVSSNALHTASSDAIVTIDATNGGTDYGPELLLDMSITVAADDEVRVLLGYDDADNWLGVQFKFQVGCTEIKYLHCVASVITTLNQQYISDANSASSFPFTRTICAGLKVTSLYAFENGTTSVWQYETGVTAPGTGIAIGTGSIGGTVDFDTIKINRYANSCVTPIEYCMQSVDYDYYPVGSLGCGWTVESGTWAQGATTITQSTAGIITHNMDLQQDDQYIEVTVGKSTAFSNTTVRVALAYVDSDNYLYVQIDGGDLWLGKRVAGVDTQIGSNIVARVSLTEPIKLQYDGEWIDFWTSGSRGYFTASTAYAPGFTGTKAALICDNYDATDGTTSFSDIAIKYCPAAMPSSQAYCNCDTDIQVYDRMIVEIPAWVDKTGCTDCASLAMTVTLLPTTDGHCEFYKRVTAPACTIDYIDIRAYFRTTTSATLRPSCSPDSRHVYVDIKLYQGGSGGMFAHYQWRSTISKSTANSLSNEAIPFYSEVLDHASAQCHDPSADCYLTWDSA